MVILLSFDADGRHYELIRRVRQGMEYAVWVRYGDGTDQVILCERAETALWHICDGD